jgi:hypothetical protein
VSRTKRINLQIPESAQLAPKTTENAIAEIRSDPIHQSVNPDNVLQKQITVHPVIIDVVTNAPIDTLQEAQQLYAITKNQTMEMLAASHKKGKIEPQLLGWVKETREQLKTIHGMTAGFQQKMAIKKIDLMAAFINSSSDLRDEFKIQMIKELEQVEAATDETQLLEIEE